VNVASQMKEPGYSNRPLFRLDRLARDPLLLRDGSKDVDLLWRSRLDAVASGSEWPVDVVPLSAAIRSIFRPDVVRPTRSEHEEHFGAFIFR
jgi:hypothetical protein